MPYTNPEDRRANAKIYRARNGERIRAYLWQWNRDNGDRRFKLDHKLFIRNLYYGIKKRSEGNWALIPVERLFELYEEQAGRCVLTGHILTHTRKKHDLDTNISVDRIDNSKGYVEGNVRLVCRRINIMRMDMSDVALRSWCQLVLLGPEECWHIPDDGSVSI